MIKARKKARAARRIKEKTRKNALAVEAAVELAEDRADQPKRRTARTRTRLEELEARSVISQVQKKAGDRLVSDYARSKSMMGRIIARYEPDRIAVSRGMPPDTPLSIVARERYDKAMDAVGPWLNSILFHTCVTDLSPTEWSRLNGKAATDGIAVLRLALDALADHYGFTSRRDRDHAPISNSTEAPPVAA